MFMAKHNLVSDLTFKFNQEYMLKGHLCVDWPLILSKKDILAYIVGSLFYVQVQHCIRPQASGKLG